LEFRYHIGGGLCRLATWHFPGGPIGPPARWAATSHIKGVSGTEEGPLVRERALVESIILRGSEFLVTPLLMGPDCLLSQGRLEEPVRPSTR